MKKRIRFFYYIILLMFLQVFLVGKPVFAGVNDFYFKDFTGDYYLSKDEEGISHLRVVESVTAVFPDFNQNKGICRQISFTNQNGNNVTLPSLTRSNITITRNGVTEPIYSIDRADGYYSVCTGTEEYVLGEQVYVFEYQFEKVVTEFSQGGREYQELYWDTNGNGALQRFDSVTARLHFEDPTVFSGDSWCYVGKYSESGQDRCIISAITDGVEFKAENLTSYENLTFDVELKKDSFAVPGPTKNYIYVWLTAILVVISGLTLIRFFCKFLKSRDKANYYKGIFVKPEYQPSDKYRLTELAEIYLGSKKDAKVAMLLEMIVNKNVELKKGEKKKWSLIVKNLTGLGQEYNDLLTILNGGDRPEEGGEIEIKRRSATTRLIALKKAMDNKVLDDLKADGLVVENYHIGGSTKRGVGNVIALTIVIVPTVIMIGAFILGVLQDLLGLDMTYGQEMVFYPEFYKVAFFTIVLTTMICVALSDSAQKYAKHTKAGLEASRYMDGLKLYIKMAEAERLEFLQSVEGADVSAQGIVKLYEKLLPYAAVFGLEKSWMEEMQAYCEVEEIEKPDYLLNGFVVSDIARNLNSAATYATNSTVMSSSGGGSSSGFSGGGGGGFSGGGGGGGGFSGR